jgi:hypothetical protein
MCHRHAFEAVSRMLQDLRDEDDPRKSLPFGGITVCFCGDFRQILPVVKKGTRGQIVDATLQRTSFWRRVNILRLIENMRLRREGSRPRRDRGSLPLQKLLRIGETTALIRPSIGAWRAARSATGCLRSRRASIAIFSAAIQAQRC